MIAMKKLAVVVSLLVAGCSGAATVKPVAPPPPPVAGTEPAPPAPPPAFVLSETAKEYKGKTWSVSVPDNLVVSDLDDNGFSAKGPDHTIFALARVDSKDDTDSIAAQVVYAMAARGHQATRMFDLKIDNRPAKLIVYMSGDNVMAWTVVGTATHGYALIYAGKDGGDRVAAYKAMLASAHMSDKPAMAAKAKAKK